MKTCRVTLVCQTDQRPFPLQGPVVVIGRSEWCHIQVLDHRVSRRHCKLVLRDTGARIFDLSSANGTWVNGSRLNQTDLRDGDLLRVGKIEFLVRIAQAEPALSAPAAMQDSRPREDAAESDILLLYERDGEPAPPLHEPSDDTKADDAPLEHQDEQYERDDDPLAGIETLVPSKAQENELTDAALDQGRAEDQPKLQDPLVSAELENIAQDDNQPPEAPAAPAATDPHPFPTTRRLLLAEEVQSLLTGGESFIWPDIPSQSAFVRPAALGGRLFNPSPPDLPLVEVQAANEAPPEPTAIESAPPAEEVVPAETASRQTEETSAETAAVESAPLEQEPAPAQAVVREVEEEPVELEEVESATLVEETLSIEAETQTEEDLLAEPVAVEFATLVQETAPAEEPPPAETTFRETQEGATEAAAAESAPPAEEVCPVSREAQQTEEPPAELEAIEPATPVEETLSTEAETQTEEDLLAEPVTVEPATLVQETATAEEPPPGETTAQEAEDGSAEAAPVQTEIDKGTPETAVPEDAAATREDAPTELEPKEATAELPISDEVLPVEETAPAGSEADEAVQGELEQLSASVVAQSPFPPLSLAASQDSQMQPQADWEWLDEWEVAADAGEDATCLEALLNDSVSALPLAPPEPEPPTGNEPVAEVAAPAAPQSTETVVEENVGEGDLAKQDEPHAQTQPPSSPPETIAPEATLEESEESAEPQETLPAQDESEEVILETELVDEPLSGLDFNAQDGLAQEEELPPAPPEPAVPGDQQGPDGDRDEPSLVISDDGDALGEREALSGPGLAVEPGPALTVSDELVWGSTQETVDDSPRLVLSDGLSNLAAPPPPEPLSLDGMDGLACEDSDGLAADESGGSLADSLAPEALAGLTDDEPPAEEPDWQPPPPAPQFVGNRIEPLDDDGLAPAEDLPARSDDQLRPELPATAVRPAAPHPVRKADHARPAATKPADRPLHEACRMGNRNLAALLLSKGANANTPAGAHAATPLHYAAGGGHVSVIDLLLRKGADPQAEDARHTTPLDWALACRKEQAARALRDVGA
ncbi:MAG: FHA domain-containing protein FhaA [Planctomycetes bacterium ADurb.Bin126]|nr:MAG: FHA domain-containing protein FhaA [Planctomycetes bacterium ADurb.Bin126]